MREWEERNIYPAASIPFTLGHSFTVTSLSSYGHSLHVAPLPWLTIASPFPFQISGGTSNPQLLLGASAVLVGSLNLVHSLANSPFSKVFSVTLLNVVSVS